MAIVCECGTILEDECGHHKVEPCEACISTAREQVVRATVKALIDEAGAMSIAEAMIDLGHSSALRAALPQLPKGVTFTPHIRKKPVCIKGPGATYSRLCSCPDCKIYNEFDKEAEGSMAREG